MSVVACRVYDDRIEIASDTITVWGTTQRKNDGKRGEYAKLMKINNLILGSVGTCEENALFQQFCATHSPRESSEDALLEFIGEFADWKKKKTELTYGQDNDYIIIIGGKAYYIERFWVKYISDYAAIGAGKEYALSALYLGHGVKSAVDAACELSIYCERPVIHIVEQKGTE